MSTFQQATGVSSRGASSKTFMRWTVEEYHSLVRSGILHGRKIELLQGDLVEVAPEGPKHTARTASGAEYLRQQFGGLALVREAHPITLSSSEPEPDLAVVRGQSHSEYEERHPYPEDIFLIVEIAQSTLAYDLGEKKQIYAEAGIQEYWVLDTTGRRLYVFRNPVAGKYTESLVSKSGELKLAAFPTVALSVDAIVR
ncbi:MAG: Uma2 family endonuclease [Cyanobacteria bacterium J06623_5]